MDNENLDENEKAKNCNENNNQQMNKDQQNAEKESENIIVPEDEIKGLTPSKMQQILDWGYDKALNGLPFTPTAYELAEDYLTKHKDVDKAINSLIKWQISKAASTGFVTGLGGAITLPVAIPVNLASVYYVQIRMVAAIAHMRGYDLKSDQVKTLVYLALVGQGANEILKEFGIELGKKFAISAIKKIPGEVIKKINQKVCFRLVTKFGEKGMINLGKLLPVVGGVIGGTFDGLSTNTVGSVAKSKLFIEG
ncbi:MAG: EcsC family protein [Bacillota bacterium]